MNKIKLEYEAPEVNTLEVKFEGCFCLSGGAGDDDSVINDPEDY